MTDPANDPVVRELRDRIAANDRAIVAAVNARLELVGELWRHKERQGYGRVDRARESEMVELLADENPGPLSEQGLRAFYSNLVELTKGEVARTPPRSPRA